MHHRERGRALVVVEPKATGVTRIGAADALSRATRLALGAVGLALGAVQALLEQTVPAEPGAPGAMRSPPRPLLLPGVAIGVGLEAQRRSLRAAAALGARLGPVWSAAAHPLVAHGPLAALGRRLDVPGWSAHGLAEQRRNQLEAAAFLRALLGALVAAVLERVDVDGVVARVDLDRVVERLDLDAIIARVDVDAILARADLAGVTERVIDEVDVGRVVRESSSTMASETVDALRVQGMQADQVLGRVVDRVLGRKGGRRTGGELP